MDRLNSPYKEWVNKGIGKKFTIRYEKNSMFDRLTDRLSNIFRNFSGVVSQSQVDEAIKEIRRSLLEADVHYKVARDLCETKVIKTALPEQFFRSE